MQKGTPVLNRRSLGFLKIRLADSLSHHSVSYFLKACDVSAHNIVALMAVTFCSTNHVVCDADHDAPQFCINFFEGPGQTLGVLGHLECGCCKQPPAFAAFPGAKITPCSCRYLVASRVVGMLAPSHTAVHPFSTSAGILKQQLVLSCARKSKVCFYNPYAASFVVLGVWTIFLVLGQTSTIYFFDLFNAATSIPSGS